ncbi:hypothetical protein QBC34DRAFT_411989 [Podospora aff. communis PSN243]|uniref:Uncharacterized protein n=1 Tax=Podospora aff. communis PSN243 TaxID=3040156 RepID=A0AAV9GGM8_9PEZI|nr:hypothetical protein QBC34DRAFT_411989 [Podospora aff. communis PSN243]
MALEEVFCSAHDQDDSDGEEDFGRQLCGRWKSLFRDLVRLYQRQSGSPALPESLTTTAARKKHVFKFLAGMKGASPVVLTKDFLLEAHPDVLAMVPDRDRRTPEGAVVEAMDGCPEVEWRRGRKEFLPLSMAFILERYGERWLEESLAIRAAIVRMAWRAGPDRLGQMMQLMPDLVEYIRDSEYPGGRKMRLVRWMVGRMHAEPGDQDGSSIDDEGYGSGARTRRRGATASKGARTKLGRLWKSFAGV